ncbi:MAG: hypothetical protein U0U70_14535 [Chitinophagaceae bacterium]
MKKLFSLIAIMLLAVTAMLGQQPAPGILNYQGVARNSVGNVLVNKNIALRLTIHDGSAAGPVVYQESRNVTTNPFGLFNVQLGSPGFLTQTGTIAGVPWGVGLKFIQVEIDPNGGLSFINIGTAQLASVPYSLYASQANDLVLPFNKTQADAGTLFKITNSGNGSGSTALEGLTNSTAANAFAIIGTVTNTAPGGFSAGVRGINNGTGGLGIGVWGSQNGSGWGVYGQTPGGIGVYGNTNTGFGLYGNATSGTGLFASSSTGVAGIFSITNNANTSNALQANSNGSGDVINASTTGTGRAGIFTVNNAASGADALFAQTNGGATSWALRATSTGAQGAAIFTYNNAGGSANAVRISNNGSGAGVFASTSGTGNAGRFDNTNAANTASTVLVNNNATTGVGLQVNQTGTGQVTGIYGNITTTIGASAAIGGADFSSGGASPVEARTYAVLGQTGSTGIGVGGYALNGGTALRGSGGGATGWALRTTGRVQLQGINEAAGRLLTSDATGSATWQDPASAGVVTGSGTVNFIPKWTPTGTNLGNSLLFDNGTSVGLGTTTPTHRFTVSHSGSTGISVSSTSGFSVLDINAASGDAAIRLGDNGVNQWNIRNRPGDDYLEIFELGGGGSRMVIQDGTGNVGIGNTTSPSYRLDVQHGGSTGIRSQSTSSFSVVDIDAASGDAALRFQSAGVGQWNTRNRPADNYYEIFELGGGGSRMVIQDGTGNVGIGATVSPSYRLDVEHGGSTGIRSRSTSSFSVVDIDAASGDAALRFANAGVNQWNIRNRPADDYLEIFELGGGGSRMVIQDGTGNVGIGATVSPSYRLDVEHGGSTGIRSRSTSSFSVVDIDGASGDAALRFANAGVNQWNTRNNPATNDYQIFELGGGGERLQIQDGTGNIGIGGVSPSYRLDVLHGGATGARVRSSSTFSIIDIDGANGDAALRFAKAGVNQWNVRNRPADDYFEIFELGGGGSRVVIQDGTGNVGIGATTSPSYRLDVEHSGATGIRVRSTATFSLVDNDAANGDAAFRFAKAGVNQWNIRNNPGNDDLQFFELGGGGERMRIENTTGHVWVDGDFDVVGVKNFAIDHPLDPQNKILRHVAAESNEPINFYSGNVVTDANGKATVTLPDYFEAINKDLRYQLTVVGTFAQAIISKEVHNNQFEIATSVPNVKVSWEVKGLRNDARLQKTPYVSVQEKRKEDKGKYLDPAAYNQPASMGIGYDGDPNSSVNAPAGAIVKSAPVSATGGSIDYVAPEPKVSANKVQGPSSTDDTPKTEAKAKRQVDGPSSTDNMPKTEVKPAAKVTGPSSTDEMPKPVENKKTSKDPGSTKE